MIDVWLPVIRKLKEKNDIKIDFVFPEPSSLHHQKIAIYLVLLSNFLMMLSIEDTLIDGLWLLH